VKILFHKIITRRRQQRSKIDKSKRWLFLLEVCTRSVGLDETSSLLLDPAWKRELDLGIVHLLDQWTTTFSGFDSLASDDLDAVGSGSMSGSHVSVTLCDGSTDSEVSVLPVHVMGSRSGVVSQPDSKVLDLQGLPLLDFLHGDDLSGGLLELPELTQKVPESTLGDNGIWSEDPHSVKRSLWLIFSWCFTTNHFEFSQSSLCSHFKSLVEVNQAILAWSF